MWIGEIIFVSIAKMSVIVYEREICHFDDMPALDFFVIDDIKRTLSISMFLFMADKMRFR